MSLVITFLLMPCGILGFGYLGLRILAVKLKGESSGWSYHLLAFTVGLIFFSYYWFLTAAIQCIHMPALYLFWGLSLLLSGVFYRRFSDFFFLKWKLLREWLRAGFWVKIIALEIYLVFFLTFIRIISGYIEGDSLLYHLNLPKQFVLHGGLWAVPYSEHAYWPLMTEMCFIPGELLQSLALSKFISYLMFVMISLWPGVFVYDRTKNIHAALLASALIATAPVFFSHAPSTYSDLSFTFFVFVGFLILGYARISREILGKLFFLSGFICGGGLSCKYLGIFGLIAFMPLVIFDAFKAGGTKRWWQFVFLFILGVVITGAPYYIRAYLHYGNPVFPFANKIFGTAFGYGLERVGFVGSNLSDFIGGTGRNVWDFLLLPITMTFMPQYFGGDKLGFLFLLCFPMVVWTWRKNLPATIFCLIYSVIWFFLSQYTRYLGPVFVVFAVMVGCAFAILATRWNRVVTMFFTLVVLVAGIQMLWAGYHTYKDIFLRKPEPVIEIAEWLNREISGPGAKAMIIGDKELYYFDFASFREVTFRNFTRYPEFKLPDETVKLLDGKGVRFIVIKTPQVSQLPERRVQGFDPELYWNALIQKGFYSQIGSRVSREGATYTAYRRSIKIV